VRPNNTPLTDEQRQLVADNHALARHALKKFRPAYRRLDPDDMLASCEDGLIRAARHYTPSDGKFSTYAFPWMLNAVKRLFYRSMMIPVPEHYWHHGKVLDTISPGLVEHARGVLSMRRIMSCRRGSESDGTGDRNSPTGIYAMEDGHPGPAEEAASRDAYGFLWEVMRSTLTPRQIECLLRTRVDGLSTRRAGRRLGCSPENVRRIADRAIRKLRGALELDAHGDVVRLSCQQNVVRNRATDRAAGPAARLRITPGGLHNRATNRAKSVA
jgi:RNA polymerase sigma factor (sigma-70 family)